MNLIQEFKKDWKTFAVTIFTIGFTSFLIVGVWIGTDPGECHEKNQNAQNACLTFTWGIRILIILLPIMVTIIVIRVFKEDPKESKNSTGNKTEEFDYTNLGANDKQ